MITFNVTGLSVQVSSTKLEAVWHNNGVLTGIVLDNTYSLSHRHFYASGECFHLVDEVSLWKCARQLGAQDFESAWDGMTMLFESGQAAVVDAYIEANCKTLASYIS